MSKIDLPFGELKKIVTEISRFKTDWFLKAYMVTNLKIFFNTFFFKIVDIWNLFVSLLFQKFHFFIIVTKWRTLEINCDHWWYKFLHGTFWNLLEPFLFHYFLDIFLKIHIFKFNFEIVNHIFFHDYSVLRPLW